MLDPALGHRQIVAYRRIPECIVSNVLVIIKSKLVGFPRQAYVAATTAARRTNSRLKVAIEAKPSSTAQHNMYYQTR